VVAVMRVCGMRTGITVDVKAADRARLEAIVADRNSRQKHVWRARIVLLTADGLGTNEIMRQTAKSKTCLWRWQERFMQTGVEGLLHDRTRPSRVPPLPPAIGERVVALTQSDPPGETTHWTAAAMGRVGPDQCLLGATHLAFARAPAAPGTAVQTVARPRIHPQAA
jgi:hypothetical protein